MVNRITINGKMHLLSGNNVTINGNQIIVDGKSVDLPDEKNITIKIEGNVGDVIVHHCNELSIAGNVSGDVETISGDINCGNVNGSIRSVSGDIRARSISIIT